MKGDAGLTDQVRAVLVEDDDDQRDALVVTLRQLGISVDGIGGVLDLYRQLLERSYDVAIVDLGLPDGDGRAVVRFLAEQSSMGVIILSSESDVEERIGGFSAGADLYFVKPVDCRELASAIRRLAARRSLGKVPAQVPANTDRSETWRLIPPLFQLVAPNGRDMMLTPKELLFVEAFAKQPGGIASRNSLIKHLGYPDDNTGSRRLEALIRRLRGKADEVLDYQMPIVTVYGLGYRFSQKLKIDTSVESKVLHPFPDV
ncbi:DNA-binding response OmpR family regulator [Azospirillum agricola]|uniref:response regulator transcription factor n=1 Tax=Azospirillum agricola TaxID=1720247 RepID=UPI001AE865E3|nr:response regulator transcription factor [Azospirillum agricola]MBP2229049.1 DNA-binding response OmpR family regulator [Azospirillum agricola]